MFSRVDSYALTHHTLVRKPPTLPSERRPTETGQPVLPYRTCTCLMPTVGLLPDRLVQAWWILIRHIMGSVQITPPRVSIPLMGSTQNWLLLASYSCLDLVHLRLRGYLFETQEYSLSLRSRPTAGLQSPRTVAPTLELNFL
jgi:hypothetical protein